MKKIDFFLRNLLTIITGLYKLSFKNTIFNILTANNQECKNSKTNHKYNKLLQHFPL